jgi:hypothetical protein
MKQFPNPQHTSRGWSGWVGGVVTALSLTVLLAAAVVLLGWSTPAVGQPADSADAASLGDVDPGLLAIVEPGPASVGRTPILPPGARQGTPGSQEVDLLLDRWTYTGPRPKPSPGH